MIDVEKGSDTWNQVGGACDYVLSPPAVSEMKFSHLGVR